MIKRVINQKYTVEELHKLLSKEGYELLSDTYENTYTKLDIKCPFGHVYITTRNSWRNGRRCPQCYKENSFGSNTPHWKGGVVERNVAIYDTYHEKISFCEDTRRYPKEKQLLQVKCKHCNKWFTPTRCQVENRLYALNRAPKYSAVENNFYCSDSCKLACPLYKKIKHYNGKPSKGTKAYTTQEIYIWSIEVRKRANFLCELCGHKATEAHHIIPKSVSSFEALDPDNGISVCKECHHKILHTDKCTAAKILKNFCGPK